MCESTWIDGSVEYHCEQIGEHLEYGEYLLGNSRTRYYSDLTLHQNAHYGWWR